jgi:hypothetical protein
MPQNQAAAFADAQEVADVLHAQSAGDRVSNADQMVLNARRGC